MGVYAVTTLNGPRWDDRRGRREQEGWTEHASFMDALVDTGAVALGGPIGDGRRVLLAMQADDEQEIHRRFTADPWIVSGVLRIGQIEPWTIWLDGTRRVPPLA